MRFLLWARIVIAFSAGVLFENGPLVHAQTTTEPEETISTDRPAVADSSVVVPKGALQFENGLLVTGAQGQSIVDFTETSVRFGLLNKTELRLGVPDYFHNLPAGTGTTSGFGDMSVGVKQQFGTFYGKFDISAVVFLSFPTGASSVSSHGYDPGLQVPWSYKLSENWTAGGQLASYWPTTAGKHTYTGETTFFIDRQLTKPWDAFLEYAGDFPQRGSPRNLLHFGSSYKLAPRHQIDVHVGVGLSGTAPDHFVGIGYSFLFHVAR
ncbi:MAG TPA: transporter [Candidatus Acidoferrum sp.]|nr:transporter [Candidatus Acidoferrum sp.]